MDWLIDSQDAESRERALTELTGHLHRHAADVDACDAAHQAVETALVDVTTGLAYGLAHGLVRLHLDWNGTRPWVGLAPVPDRSVLDELGLTPGALVPVDKRSRLSDLPKDTLVHLPLPTERRLGAAFDAGPPLLAALDVDPRRDGPASAAVALSVVSEVHPNANASQTASTAGAALADGMLGDTGQIEAAGAARLISDAHCALGSDARVVSADQEGIELTISRCPFGKGVARTGSLCHLSVGLAGRVATRVTGEATVLLRESLAAGDDECHLQVWLGKPPDDVDGEQFRWPPATAGPDGPVPRLNLSLTLPRESGSVPVVRRLAVQALTAFGVTREDVEDVELAITEACANVIDHAADTDTYEVQVELASDECAITVVDRGTGFDATEIDENAPDHSETGRGLALMRALVDNVAFRSEPRAGAVVHMVKTLRYDPDHPLWRRPPRAGSAPDAEG